MKITVQQRIAVRNAVNQLMQTVDLVLRKQGSSVPQPFVPNHVTVIPKVPVIRPDLMYLMQKLRKKMNVVWQLFRRLTDGLGHCQCIQQLKH